MIVITLTDCPPALRGDLSKWLMEVNTGVFVGQVSARVRDALWERVTANIRQGRATMVFDAANEQHMDFRIHNTTWEIVDFDGLQLVRRPSEKRLSQRREEEAQALPDGFSRAAHNQQLRRIQRSQARKGFPPDFVIIDIETTGLDAARDAIIEIAALRGRNYEPGESLNLLVRPGLAIPPEIQELTGLTDEIVNENGIALQEALQRLAEFVGTDPLIIHNAHCFKHPRGVLSDCLTVNRCRTFIHFINIVSA